MNWYDRQGRPLPSTTPEDWAAIEALLSDVAYKRVAETTIETPLGPVWVSTVWLGLDHRFMGDGPPLIFESMVFDHGEVSEGRGIDLMGQRYATEVEALAGHDQLVAETRAFLAPIVEELLRPECQEPPQ